MAVSTKRKNYKDYCEAFKQLKKMIRFGLVVVRPAEDVDLKSLQSTLHAQHYTLVAEILETKAQGEQQGEHHDEL